jgi:hypothetical protein
MQRKRTSAKHRDPFLKHAAIVLFTMLIGSAILSAPVFGGGPTTHWFHITITIDGKTVATFYAPGNKDGTRIVGEDIIVQMDFPIGVVPPDEKQSWPSRFNDYPDREFRWSPLEDEWLGIDWIDPDDGSWCYDEEQQEDISLLYLQILNSTKWRFHHISISSNNRLNCRFDLFYEYTAEDGGAHDHYIFRIMMEFVKEGDTYSDDNAKINWTHYTETTQTKGKKLDVDFQQLGYSCHGSVTIIIKAANIEG